MIRALAVRLIAAELTITKLRIAAEQALDMTTTKDRDNLAFALSALGIVPTPQEIAKFHVLLTWREYDTQAASEWFVAWIENRHPTAIANSATGTGDAVTTPVSAQINHLLNLEAAYKVVCEKREKIPFKWGPQPERDALQERADGLAGEIMRTERRIIEGLKEFGSP